MSLTIQGWAAGIVLAGLQWADITIATDDVTTFITVVLGLFSGVGVYIGRYRKGDIYWYGKRKEV